MRLRAHPVMVSLGCFVPVAALCAGCAALGDDMARAQTSYDEARYEDALVWLRDLEEDAPSMELDMRARYFYLRGMTEYRLGNRDEALYYLAVAREVVGDEGAGRRLRSEWRHIMERTLSELTPRGRSHRPPPAEGAVEATGGGEDRRSELSGPEIGSSEVR